MSVFVCGMSVFLCGLILIGSTMIVLALLAAPWGTKVDRLGFYFYRYNSGMTLILPGTRTLLLSWDTGRLSGRWLEKAD